MLKFRESVEDKRNNSHSGQEPKKLHGMAKVAITTQGCASTRGKVKIYRVGWGNLGRWGLFSLMQLK